MGLKGWQKMNIEGDSPNTAAANVCLNKNQINYLDFN